MWIPVVGEFTNESWAAVLVSYVVAALAYRFLLPGKGLADTWLTALQGMVAGIDPVPERWAPRSVLP